MMHEHCLLEPDKSEIGPTREGISAESKSESEAMSDASYDALGSRIEPSNGGHDSGPVFLGKPIHSRPTWSRSGPSDSARQPRNPKSLCRRRARAFTGRRGQIVKPCA